MRIPHSFLAAAALLAGGWALPHAPAAAQQARKGTILISQAWSRATAPRAQVGAGFLTIRNTDARPDRLLSASSPRAAKVEIHTMSMDGGVMRMRPLPDGLEIPARSVATLAPGGNHLMLIGLKAPLKQGDLVPATLRFARAGTIQVQLAVAAPGAPAPSGSGGHQ
ncbi:copper chaperone PCu(A)C [Sphingomonas sp. HF-S4]|uniref:Copper chaperone PCu(A)C n=1 Tax=Sphingomonas agrestis TaxID=3080540 RepID=A0ABU3Y654_9SPHN|nr:copper chaperone PCu(A)C [Sphingomonas sp. HF-S4]MDV3456871.1 copper chaperone PCu(A)C [Sphingomonas sp. HF-S4]